MFFSITSWFLTYCTILLLMFVGLKLCSSLLIFFCSAYIFFCIVVVLFYIDYVYRFDAVFLFIYFFVLVFFLLVVLEKACVNPQSPGRPESHKNVEKQYTQ